MKASRKPKVVAGAGCEERSAPVYVAASVGDELAGDPDRVSIHRRVAEIAPARARRVADLGLVAREAVVLRSAIAAANVNLAKGNFDGMRNSYTIGANDQLLTSKDYKPLVVAYRNGSPVRLNELGRVIDSVQNDKTASWFNGTRAIVLAIQKQPGTNTVAVVDRIKKLIGDLVVVGDPQVQTRQTGGHDHLQQTAQLDLLRAGLHGCQQTGHWRRLHDT